MNLNPHVQTLLEAVYGIPAKPVEVLRMDLGVPYTQPDGTPDVIHGPLVLHIDPHHRPFSGGLHVRVDFNATADLNLKLYERDRTVRRQAGSIQVTGTFTYGDFLDGEPRFVSGLSAKLTLQKLYGATSISTHPTSVMCADNTFQRAFHAALEGLHATCTQEFIQVARQALRTLRRQPSRTALQNDVMHDLQGFLRCPEEHDALNWGWIDGAAPVLDTTAPSDTQGHLHKYARYVGWENDAPYPFAYGMTRHIGVSGVQHGTLRFTFSQQERGWGFDWVFVCRQQVELKGHLSIRGDLATVTLEQAPLADDLDELRVRQAIEGLTARLVRDAVHVLLLLRERLELFEVAYGPMEPIVGVQRLVSGLLGSAMELDPSR